MGNLYSNLPVVTPKNYEEVEEEECSSDPSTPLPPSHNTTDGKLLRPFTALIDPRSPTVGVSRTPVEVVAEREKLRQEMVRKLQALEVPVGGVQIAGKTPDSLVTPTGFLDPRSPTLEYRRTPLALGEKTNILVVEGSKDEGSCGGNLIIEDVDGKKVTDTETQGPVVGGVKTCRDLRKRLFVEKINESLATSEENKEN